MHIIWLAWQLVPAWGVDKEQVADAFAGLHICVPIAVEPFFILFNGVRREVTKSYSRIFSHYCQSGLIAHWFSQEDSQIENVLPRSCSASGPAQEDSYSEPVFEPLRPRDLAGACLVLIICILLSVVGQILEWSASMSRV